MLLPNVEPFPTPDAASNHQLDAVRVEKLAQLFLHVEDEAIFALFTGLVFVDSKAVFVDAFSVEKSESRAKAGKAIASLGVVVATEGGNFQALLSRRVVGSSTD